MAVSSRLDESTPTTTVADAARSIAADATVAVSGFGRVGYPKAIPGALAQSDRDLSLTVVSGGSVGDAIDTDLVEADAIDRRYPFVATQAMRDAINDGSVAFADRHIAGLADEIEFGGLPDVDVAIVEAVAVGDDWLIPSTSLGPTPAAVAAADEVIVEVNQAQPLELQRIHDVFRRERPPDRGPIPLTDVDGRIGNGRIEFPAEKLRAVVRTRKRDDPYTFRDPTTAEDDIAANLIDFLESEVETNPLFAESLTLQFGVGSVGNALMSGIRDAGFDDVDLRYFGEVVQDGLLDLLDDDLLDGASATSLALSTEGQDRLFENIDRYAEDIVLRPSAISNDASLIDRFGVVAVNSALSVDLTGNVNSTHIGGSNLVNGIGGSGDFNRHGAISIVALPSTAAGGDISRIVPVAEHVDHTEHDVDVVITEHGVADLRGRTPRERAALLREQCADPNYREELRAYVRRTQDSGGHVPYDLDALVAWKD
ncbi:acetyl-CoA hydrolase/transferase C-terminal domain-containing protein [Haloarculaceae archaeon H-GB2-1]|nr:acetyl-CoA hydrolase/transferase C-terminal domain-containing protein [Haloarculaceae archaeon H-GB1-1]MEA5386404.1 acetyl-CoA hydrolase/transferase C-terminal domain-containing protein [Haloarculaceae archaeon H-GB11]MEA5407914.1 acetyl-CoA hydrolase/transferase C-terminal domain-containing protein [Haloarculaceae archaeon H-GB2-1]